MSLHYLLDGYNIIKKAPRLAKAALRDGRSMLFQWIEISRPQGSFQNHVTVIFDGKADHFSPPPAGSARAVFTRDESADDCIKRIIEEARDIKQFVVVSDDKGIKLYVRALGAKVMGVREFAAGLFGPARTAGPGSKAIEVHKKYISLAQEQKINAELERIWIK